MKEFLKSLGRLQEEDYVTAEEFFGVFDAVMEAVKASTVNNSERIKQITNVVDQEAERLENHFKVLLDAVDERISQVKDGEPGANGDTPVAGIDYPDYQEIRDFIKDEVEKLPKQSDPTETITIDYIKDSLMSLEGNDRLPHTAINGIEQFIDEKVRLLGADLRRGPAIITGGGTGSGSSGPVEGTDILSTGETGGTKFLRENGDGTSSWIAVPGGGDALTSNPLSQFAATTSLQLKGVISDETGSGALVFATSPTLVTPILGTPTSGTLTNCTGLPVSGITASTSTAIGVGSINLGHASDTTIARVSAGVISVEGVTVATANTALMDSEVTNLAQVKAFSSADYATAAQGAKADAAPTISSGDGAPTSTPTKVGDIYVDKTGDDAYIAVGTASSADWEKTNDGAGGGSGDVVGPASSTDNAVARFDSTTGKLLQNSTMTVSDTGAYTAADGSKVTGSAGGGFGYVVQAIENTNSGGRVELSLDTDDGAYAGFIAQAGSATTNDARQFDIGTRVAGGLGFWTTDTRRAHITAAGLFSIGANDADAALSVQSLSQNAVVNIYGVSSSTDYGAIQVSNSGNLTNSSTRPLVLQPNAGRVETGGSLFVGTTLELGNTSDTTLSRVSAGVIAVEGVTVPTISSTSTLTNKTLTTPAIASIKGTLTTDIDAATITFDKNVSDFHNVVLGGNRTLALSNMAAGDRIVLRLTQDGTGSRTVTWFTTIKWADGGTAPTLTTTASKADIFGFLCTSTGNYDGFVIGQNI